MLAWLSLGEAGSTAEGTVVVAASTAEGIVVVEGGILVAVSTGWVVAAAIVAAV